MPGLRLGCARRKIAYLWAATLILPVVAAVFLPFGIAEAQFGAATSAGVDSTLRSAQERVGMDALTRHGSGTQGGCTPVPPGWTALSVVVNFPSEIG
ncbi:MAG: hypothetical protein M0T84_09010, partial [Betaproteobacteria bacterium]|nr:hypothetical protein [Betaproteobacteria bacterium]